jgi:spore germination cell wall hydrolase CwlJ-like protein
MATLGWGIPAAKADQPALILASASLGNTSSDAQISCLAKNIYWESRSEPRTGQLAVAHVTVNRMVHPKFPSTICGVVYQGDESTFGRCQFSWWCDGKSDHPTEHGAWKSALKLAAAVVSRKHPDPTNGALFFHNHQVRPHWAARKRLSARIGNHLFYH